MFSKKDTNKIYNLLNYVLVDSIKVTSASGKILNVDKKKLSEKNLARFNIAESLHNEKEQSVLINSVILSKTQRNSHEFNEVAFKIFDDSREVIDELTSLTKNIIKEDDPETSAFAESVLRDIERKEESLSSSMELFDDLRDKIKNKKSFLGFF
jgi:hypothetical protein